MTHCVKYNFCSRKFSLCRSKNLGLTVPAEAEVNNYIGRLNDLSYNGGHWWYDFALNILLPLWILFVLATLGLIIAHGSVNPEWECYDREDWYNYPPAEIVRYNVLSLPNSVYPRYGYFSLQDCLDYRGDIKKRLRIALWVIGFITLGLAVLLLLAMILFKNKADAFWSQVGNESANFRNRIAPLRYSVHQTYPGCCGSNYWKTSITPGAPTAIVTEYNTYASNDAVQLNVQAHNPSDKRTYVTGTTTTTTYN